ncbi:MAG: hypothetical protein ACREJX_15145, partial [Polyangiaceae bacterium]
HPRRRLSPARSRQIAEQKMALSFRTKLLASHVGLVLVVVLLSFFQLNRSLAADLERQIDLRL